MDADELGRAASDGDSHPMNDDGSEGLQKSNFINHEVGIKQTVKYPSDQTTNQPTDY